jgi:Flp pilus assembly protein TadD
MTMMIESRSRVVAAVMVLLMAAAVASAVDDPGRRRALDHYRKGKALMRTESWAEAVPEFRAALKLNPLLVMAYYDLGQTLMALKRYPDAIEAYLGCQKAYGEAAASREADAQDTREDQLHALQDDERALRLEIQRLPATSSRALYLQERIARVQAQMDSLKRLRGVKGNAAVDPPAEVLLALGSAYYRSGDADAAEREYRAAVTFDPKLGEAHNNLAVIYLLSGRLDEAEKAIKLAEKGGVRVSPDLKKELEGRRKAAPAP